MSSSRILSLTPAPVGTHVWVWEYERNYDTGDYVKDDQDRKQTRQVEYAVVAFALLLDEDTGPDPRIEPVIAWSRHGKWGGSGFVPVSQLIGKEIADVMEISYSPVYG